MSVNELSRARQALAAGDRTAARAILGGLVQRSLADAEVWLLLSQTVDAVAHKRDCIQRALQADPSSAAAQQALAALDPPSVAPALISPPTAPPLTQQMEAAPAPAMIPPASPVPAPAPTPATPAGFTPPARPEPPQKSRLATVLVGIGSGLVLGALIIGAVMVLKDQSAAGNNSAAQSNPPPARTARPTATVNFSAPGGILLTPDPRRPTNTPLPADEIPASLLIDGLVAFEHPETGISGLRPKNWTLFSGPTGFQVSTSPEAPDGFIGAVLPAAEFVGGSAEQTTKKTFADFKKNSAAGQAPVILEETYSKDGSGILLVESTQTAQGSTAPIRFTIYARTTVTANGLLLALATVPSEMFPAEEAFVRQMVDSLVIK